MIRSSGCLINFKADILSERLCCVENNHIWSVGFFVCSMRVDLLIKLFNLLQARLKFLLHWHFPNFWFILEKTNLLYPFTPL